MKICLKRVLSRPNLCLYKIWYLSLGFIGGVLHKGYKSLWLSGFLAGNIHFSKLEGRRKQTSGKHDNKQSSAWVGTAHSPRSLCVAQQPWTCLCVVACEISSFSKGPSPKKLTWPSTQSHTCKSCLTLVSVLKLPPRNAGGFNKSPVIKA